MSQNIAFNLRQDVIVRSGLVSEVVSSSDKMPSAFDLARTGDDEAFSCFQCTFAALHHSLEKIPIDCSVGSRCRVALRRRNSRVNE